MLSLIVNPSAGGGRAGRALPDVQAALRGWASSTTSSRRKASSTHGSWRGRRRAEGRSRSRSAATGWSGRSPERSSTPRRTLGCCPAAAETISPACWGSRSSRRRPALSSRRAPSAQLDLGEAGRATFIGIASCGFDSEANRIANQTRLVRGNLVYAYGALRALAGWQPAHFESASTARAPSGSPAIRSPRQLQGIRRRNVPRPRRLARGRPARRGPGRGRAEAAVPATAADGVQGRARRAAQRAGPSRAPASRSAPSAPSRCTPTAIRSASSRWCSSALPRRCA